MDQISNRFQQILNEIAEVKQQIHHLGTQLTEEIKKLQALLAAQDQSSAKGPGKAKRKTTKK